MIVVPYEIPCNVEQSCMYCLYHRRQPAGNYRREKEKRDYFRDSMIAAPQIPRPANRVRGERGDLVVGTGAGDAVVTAADTAAVVGAISWKVVLV
jgi:hypothetical protein